MESMRMRKGTFVIEDQFGPYPGYTTGSVPLPNRWRRDPQESKALGVERVSFATRGLEHVPRPARWPPYNGQHIDCRSLHRSVGEAATMHG
jgi:hypothetical protein